MSVVRSGRGGPVTVFAPGEGATVADTQLRAGGVGGTTIFFEYEDVAPWTVSGGSSSQRPRRQADRDADELLALADEHQATRAVGFSRGARAIVGALAEEPDRFDRLALVLPPGGHAAGRYAAWLEALPNDTPGESTTSAQILVVGLRGDQAHPARVAQDWAERLGARLEVFPSADLDTAHNERFRTVLTKFLNE